MKTKLLLLSAALFMSACDSNSPQPPLTLEDFGYANLENYATQPPLGLRPILILRVQGPGGAFPHTQTVQEIEDRFFNSSTSISAYFEKVSDGMFSWKNAGIYGVFDLGQDFPEMYQTLEKALQLANQNGIDFAQFDTNGDSIIDTSELGLVVLDNYSLEGGAVRDVPCVPSNGNVTVCLRGALLGSTPGLFVTAHELSHTLGTLDLYGSGCLSLFGSLMSCAPGRDLYSTLDPWHRMRLGWIEPQIMGVDGYRYHADDNTTPAFIGTARPPGYIPPPGWDGTPAPVTDTALNSIAAAQGGCFRINGNNSVGSRPLVLYSNARGSREFFMIESRMNTFDDFAFERLDRDVFIWQVRTDQTNLIYNIQSRFNEYGMDMSLFLYGQEGLRGNAHPWTVADGDIALHWIDGRDSGIQIRVSEPLDDSVQNVQYHSVEVGTAGQYPIPGDVREASTLGDTITVQGELGLGSSQWSILSNGVRIPLTPLTKDCGKWTFERPEDISNEVLRTSSLYREDEKICDSIPCTQPIQY